MDTLNIDPRNIHDNIHFNQAKQSTPFEYFGFHWMVGRPWGIAHPKHICWNSPDVVAYAKDDSKVKPEIRLGVGFENRTFDFGEDGTGIYPWKVGYVTSVESFRYGRLSVDFILPQGSNLWPAIWLSDCATWPPEIDIVEGWTNSILSGKRCYRRTWKGIPIPFTNEIFPGVHLGNNAKIHYGRSFRNKLKGTCSSYLHTDGRVNNCTIYWHPKWIDIYYNGHQVAHVEDEETLKWFNESEGMQIHLNNYVTNAFRGEDFKKLEDSERSCLRIMGLKYDGYDWDKEKNN